MKSVDPIGLARLIGTPTPFNEQNMNATYRGQIIVAGDVIKSAFIKDLSQRELGVELLVAATGKLLGMPIPNAYLVLSNKKLATAIGPLINSGERLLFASEDAMTPSLTRFASSSVAKQQSVLRILANMKPIDLLFVLDTWIANIDRNPGNLLLGPNGMWFIDHGQAMGGPSHDWTLFHPDSKFPQKLTSELVNFMDNRQKQEVSQTCKAFPTTAKAVDFSNLVGATYIKAILGAGDFDLASNFLEKRKGNVPKLGSATVGIEIIA